MQVIWALGISMICLAGLIHLPNKLILLFGFVIVGGHNLLDNVHFDSMIWSALHEPKIYQIDESQVFRITYPVLPWIGIMALGYCFGSLYTNSTDAKQRIKLLWQLGTTSILAFVSIRLLNIYGDPNPWSQQDTPFLTFLSFLNTEKYPPSLLFTLMTLGPSLIFLAISEKATGKLAQPLIRIGRVPMFFYIIHIYLIHLAAMIAAEFSGYDWRDMILQKRTWIDPQLKGYGFPLGVAYLVWIGIVLLLYPLCKWYDKYKTAHKEKWWLSYL
jgi:uncharacterized membrane protein